MSARPRLRPVPIAMGGLLVAVFFGLGETVAGLEISYQPPFTRHPPGELYFWLAHALLLVPASALIGYGLAPWLGPLLARAHHRIEAMSRQELVAGLVVTLVFGMLIARLGHAVVLLEQPLTDDEHAVRFGGQVLASGAVTVEAPPLFPRTSKLFLLIDEEGKVTSFDWLGGQLTSALAELTHLGPLVFALLAAVPLAALGFLLGRTLGRSYGVAAVLMFACSPMAFALSLTTHAHLTSRALVALTLCGYIAATTSDRDRTWPWVGCGLALGGALITRPFESATLLLPLAAALLVDALRGDTRARRGLLLAAAGAMLPLAVFFLHSWAVTGNALQPPRMIDGAFKNRLDSGLPDSLHMLWNRFGANTSYNLFMLAVWFLGPLGVLLVLLGTRANRLCVLLATGVGLNLLLGLMHENHGIHSVGPIHYSEATIPLTIIAAHGLAALRRWLASHQLGFQLPATMVTASLLLALGLFNVWNARGLHRQAEIHSQLYNIVDDPSRPRAVVLAPQYGTLWYSIAPYKRVGSWVFEWRRPAPNGTDHTVLVRDIPGREQEVRDAYPDRELYRLVRIPRPPWIAIVPVP